MKWSRDRIAGRVYACDCDACECSGAVPARGEVCEDCGCGLCRGKARITMPRREAAEAED